MKLCEREQRPDILSSTVCCAEAGESAPGTGGNEIEMECQAMIGASNLASTLSDGSAKMVKFFNPDFSAR